ncbi:glyceraldehyde 3-phosphate dehydrogenase [Desulfotomaculum arcticum]|uniref:Glyceraldehyde-3-phosphate dehydrogenase n=1 Tax=Desulfotruncus arcticus DSM 17038 TaxID=1121424 RepID=A0A1I2UMT1_9FIRM|nr:type I glyceraldehyde-3-phosphate dehydrogenase [Desulfotruncus arcticus]SFG78462.1 glyceraldehyde 3-phosphate dehydrogenase [Desulfotomaculum arcticum] [Desulfotruncus arcticus DSM 17038]
MTIKIGINGFGRIGRNVFRAALNNPEVEVIAVNDLTDARTLAHLLKYDSVHGVLNAEVRAEEGSFMVNEKKVRVLAERDPAELPWGNLGVSMVVESTGRFTKGEEAAAHLRAGARKVIISAPGKNVDATIVMGVNHNDYNPEKDNVVSNASCTTNCLAPVVKVLHQRFKINNGMMTTVHSYTNDQQILDLPHKDLRRARAAGVSIIPTTTGAAKAVGLVIPELQGKLNGLSMRVPTPNVSVVDFVAVVERATSAEEVNEALRSSAEGELKGIMAYSDAPLVSKDYYGDSHSSIVDAPSTMVMDGKLVKVLAWYDNEWGYSCRVLDLLLYMAKRESGNVPKITWTGITRTDMYRSVTAAYVPPIKS